MWNSSAGGPGTLALAGVLSIIFLGCSANINLIRADMEAHRGHQLIKNQDWFHAVYALGKAVDPAPDRAFHQWDMARLC